MFFTAHLHLNGCWFSSFCYFLQLRKKLRRMVLFRCPCATDAKNATTATLPQPLRLLQMPQTLQKGYSFWVKSKNSAFQYVQFVMCELSVQCVQSVTCGLFRISNFIQCNGKGYCPSHTRIPPQFWSEGSFVKKVITKTSLQLAFYIAKTREKMKLSQTQLSKKTGITQCDISRIEGGVANPTIETLSRICEALNLEIKVCKTQKM